MTPAKFRSLPPIEMLTSVVDELSADSWLALTSVDFAPEHATEVYEAGACALAHSCENAFVLRRQLPLSLV
jgi:hypothetical protein